MQDGVATHVKARWFDDLPSNAQSLLTNYRARLETMVCTDRR
jgi:hypothetical protein